LQQNVRSSLDMMIRDIRLAGLDPEATGEFGIIAVTPQRIKFTADRDMDGELDIPNAADGIDLPDLEYMEYEFDNSNGIVKMSLYKPDGTTKEISDILVENVTGLTFSYFTSNDVTTSNLDDIRTVGIEMTIKKISARDGPVSRTLIKRVICRNLDYQ